MADPDIDDLLRDRGHRVTDQRRAVWQALVEGEGHRTAEEIAAAANRDAEVNLASVYRSLALFAELDLARETRLGGEEASHWEVAHPDEHFHLVCDDCGAVDHHVGTLVQQIRDHLSVGHGFEPTDIELNVRGRCATCRTAHEAG